MKDTTAHGHFPKQNWLKIESSKSSVVVLPTISPTFDVMRIPSGNCRCSECKFMKMNTLEKVRDCMKNLAPRVELPEHILKRARLPIERMLEISAR